MINLKNGVLRSASGDARTAAARELVNRTLAQHGLTSPLDGAHDAYSPMTLPLSALGSRLADFDLPTTGVAGPRVLIPEGAEFRQDLHECSAGSRAFRTYIPSTANQGVTGLLVMLHGCTQNPEDFAIGTGMNALAEKHRFVVVYPQQSRGDNAQSCWNWFSRADQRRDRGEPAILAGMTRKVMADHGVSNTQTFVAGLSAGAAMAVILGETYPDVFAAVGAHSGLPFGAAKDVSSAFAAMAGNVPGVVIRESGDRASAVRTIVFHGAADKTVHPSNSDEIARQVMDSKASQTIASEQRGSSSGRSFRRKITVNVDGGTELEHWFVDGLGHAWSGGQPGGSYTDGKGPDASAEMVRFFFEKSDGE